MKRVASAFFLLIVLCLVSASLPKINIAKSLPSTIVVPDDYLTIQSAVNSAFQGDTILVKKGVYQEKPITVNKPLSITANSGGEVNITANQGRLFSVNSHNVTIQGFTLKNITSYGISASESDNLNIFYNTIEGNSLSTDAAGISIGDSSYVNITGNVASQLKVGINFGSTSRWYTPTNCTLINNKVSSNTGNGIDIGSDNVTLIGNEATSNGGVGIIFSGKTCVIRDNQAKRNADYGMRIGGSDIKLSNNAVSYNKHGLGIFCNNCSLTDNSVVSNDYYGFRLLNVEGVSMSGNIMADNGYNFGVMEFANDQLSYDLRIDSSNTINGKKVYYLVNQVAFVISPESFPDIGFLALVNCTNIIAKNLTLTNNIVGVTLAYSKDCEIDNMQIVNNEFGIRLYKCESITISNSNVSSSDKGGIQLMWYGRFCRIINNTITSNGALKIPEIDFQDNYGISLGDSNDCTVAGNTVSNNPAGIALRNSYNNTIYHNNFIDNTIQLAPPTIWEFMVPNRWDLNYQGNYWSDYNGKDTNGDGIGDTLLPVQNVDWYPLMKPFATSEFPNGSPKPEFFPTEWIVAAVVTVTVVGAGLIIYFRKRHR